MLIIGVLHNGLNLVGVSPFIQQVVIGVVIAVAVTMDTLRRRRAERHDAEGRGTAAPGLQLQNPREGLREMAKAFATLAASVLAGIGAAAWTASPAQAQQIGLAVANLQANFFNQIKQSVEAEGAAKNVPVTTVDAHGDSATQVNQIQDLITKGIKALIYIPAGATAAGVPVRAAHEAHIPVINVDRNAPDAPGDTFIATDSVAAARTLGATMSGKITSGKGNVAIIQGQLGTTPEQDRDKGFNEALAKCPGLKGGRQAAEQGLAPGRRLRDRAGHVAAPSRHHRLLRPRRRAGTRRRAGGEGRQSGGTRSSSSASTVTPPACSR